METNLKQPTIEYCLYARKSTEDDERQAMSIDSQIKEMTDLAIRDNLYVKEIRTEKHSAKASGRRPVFAQLLEDIRSGIFNGILTWAPDRLSRNAGDLGMLVDLMDQEKLAQIKTFSQSFSNNPNEKFLLMILCSQAKLENDNRGINVKRGMRARCSMGWRPTAPPVGYLSQPDKSNPQLIITDTERAFVIKQIFERVGNQGQSGRTIKSWLDRIQFTTKNNKGLVLSKIYTTLKNPFYYGRFEWPVGSGIWYEGKHEPLVSKELFDKVQIQLQVPPKTWKKNIFPFKKIFICGGCRGGITAEVKLKKLKLGGFTKHVYYHCARSVDYDCDEPYLTEEELIRQLIFNIDNITFNLSGMTRKIQEDIERYHRLKSEVLNQEYLIGNLQELTHRVDNDERQEMMKNYLKHILTIGTSEERQEILAFIKTKFILQDRHITVSK